jgi:5-oxoprolinase (ATP-hydrolysing) subunit A
MLATDINCDMGESTHLWHYDIEKDLALLPWISSMNIACGFHAGDPHTMHELVAAALKAGVAIGAHPSYNDRDNFGRSGMVLSPEKVYDLVLYQVGALQAFLQVHATSLHHVKPHGALYNMAAADTVLATAICQAVKDLDENLLLYGLSGSLLISTALDMGLPTASEVFADRTYRNDGSLTPRSEANALIEEDAVAIAQVLQMVQEGIVHTTTGNKVAITAETICIHSDGAHALAFAQQIHHTLKQHGIEIKPV